MREVVSGLWQIPLVPREVVNAYLAGDVLIDAGTPGMGKKLPERLSGRPLAAHAITHAHETTLAAPRPSATRSGSSSGHRPVTPMTPSAAAR